ncbi:MAG TPA: response regulator [Bryobacteraceae bacterium]|nr:response regulator [Bryobacteraceae bacterium]
MSAPILIVDDNEDNLKLTQMLLEYEGYDVETAADAEQALKIVQTCRPSLILMDLQLPGMDGLQLTRRLRAMPALRKVPVVALTAYAMQTDEENARAAGCDGYITKPIHTRSFAALIRQYVAPKQAD